MRFNTQRIIWLSFALIPLEIILLHLVPTEIQNTQYSGHLDFTPPNMQTGTIVVGTKIVQEFEIQNVRGMTALDIFFSTFARNNPSTLDVELKDKSGIIIHHESITANSLLNDTFYRMDFPTQESSAGNRYTLTITSPDATEHTGVSSRYGHAALEGTTFLYNDQLVNGTLFIVPLHELKGINRMYLLADRIHANKGNLVPPFLTYTTLVMVALAGNILILLLIKEGVVLIQKRRKTLSAA